MFSSNDSPVLGQVKQVRALAAGLAVVALCSCSGSSMAPAAGPGSSSAQITGRVQGGQQPVAGSQVTIYLAGTGTGYGQGDTVLAGPITSDANGMFSLAGGSVACPSGEDPPVYVVAAGGDAGSGSNSALALSAALAHCSQLATAFLNVDEVTTVASVWALSQFLDQSGVHLGAPSTNTVGLDNAAGMIANLADVTTGQAVTSLVSGATGVPPAAAVNTLANILAQCVNSDGSVTSGSACGQLFTAATPPGGAAPADTLAAGWNIARNPGNNAAALFRPTSSADPFQTPQPLQTAPSDWTLAIQITDGTLNPVTGLSIDAEGNAWIVTTAASALREVTPSLVQAAGSPFSGGGLMAPAVGRLVIDSNGNIWVGTSTSNASIQALAVFGSDGQPLAGSPATAAGLDALSVGGMAADTTGNMWVISTSNAGRGTLTEFSQEADAFTTTTLAIPAPPALVFANFLGFDSTGNIFTDYGFSTEITAETPAGAALPGSPYQTAANDQNGQILGAQDGSAWVLDSGGLNLIHLTPDGSGGDTPSVIDISAVLPGGPNLGAFDGRGNLWIVGNSDGAVGPSLLEVDSAGTPAAGSPFQNGALGQSFATAIDRSGNIWIGGEAVGSGLVPLVVVIGAAAPVRTPVTTVAQLP